MQKRKEYHVTLQNCYGVNLCPRALEGKSGPALSASQIHLETCLSGSSLFLCAHFIGKHCCVVFRIYPLQIFFFKDKHKSDENLAFHPGWGQPQTHAFPRVAAVCHCSNCWYPGNIRPGPLSQSRAPTPSLVGLGRGKLGLLMARSSGCVKAFLRNSGCQAHRS